MKNRKLFVVTRHNFSQYLVEEKYNVSGDLNIYKKQPEDFESDSSTLIGVFSKKENVEHFLDDKSINFLSENDESDAYGSYTSYIYISGHYHTASEQELEVVDINGKKYAGYDHAFVEIDEKVSKDVSSQEQEGALGE